MSETHLPRTYADLCRSVVEFYSSALDGPPDPDDDIDIFSHHMATNFRALADLLAGIDLEMLETPSACLGKVQELLDKLCAPLSDP